MIITNCPRCGSMNATTTCTKCGWSQFNKSTVSTGVYKTIGELEIKVTGKALLDDYKRLLFENNSLTVRIAELEAELDVEKRLSNQLYLLLVDNPKEKKLADLLTEAIRGTDAPIFAEDKK